jgi:hypothetical protein
MAKFYNRKVGNLLTKDQIVYYGYKGTNFVFNGQRFDATTGNAVPNAISRNPVYDTVAASSTLNVTGGTGQDNSVVPLGSKYIAIIAAQQIFEPSHVGNNYDLLGSRWSAEYNLNTFYSFGTQKNSYGNWFFKNLSVVPSNVSVVNSTTGEATTGGVSGGDTTVTSPGVVTGGGIKPVLSSESSWNQFIPVESPSGTYTYFYPKTLLKVGSSASSSANVNYTYTNSYNEALYGSTLSSTYTYTVITGADDRVSLYAYPSTNTANFTLDTTTASNTAQRFGTVENTAAQRLDSEIYGSGVNTKFTLVPSSGAITSSANRTEFIHGAYPSHADNVGTFDYGVRIFIKRTANHLYYLHYNSGNGGIQGVDTSVDNVDRLSLKVVNFGTSTTTVLENYKKGVSGIVVPSQPDLDDESNYRYYMMSFTGADAAAQGINIYRTNINLSTQLDTQTLYTNTMTTQQAQEFYAAMGHNATANSTFNNSNHRRSTASRIWYSTDSSNVKRLHLGIYNTNAGGYITAANGFSSQAGAGSMFVVYSWTLNDGTSTATYLGKFETAAWTPRYFCPMDTNWRQLYVGSSTNFDAIFSLNETTGLYQLRSLMSYNAARLFKDKDGRWCTQVFDTDVAVTDECFGNYIDVITADVAQTVSITTSGATSFTYQGTTINSTITVNVYDYLGARVAKSVALSIISTTGLPGVQFSDGTVSKTITTSASADTSVAIRVVGANGGKIIGSVISS